MGAGASSSTLKVEEGKLSSKSSNGTPSPISQQQQNLSPNSGSSQQNNFFLSNNMYTDDYLYDNRDSYSENANTDMFAHTAMSLGT